MRRDVGACIRILQAMDKPAVLVPGNNESEKELACACAEWKSARVLHGSGVMIDGVSVFGLGGGVPVTPFGSWSIDLTEEQAADLPALCPARGVLVSHSPPKGVVDLSSRGQSLGSTAGRATGGYALDLTCWSFAWMSLTMVSRPCQREQVSIFLLPNRERK